MANNWYRITDTVDEKGNNRRIAVHTLIAETALGHRLPKNACVHHVDGNELNNSNKNLVICQDQKYHLMLHVNARLRAKGANWQTERICCNCGIVPKDSFYPSQQTSAVRWCKTCMKTIEKGYRDSGYIKKGRSKPDPIRSQRAKAVWAKRRELTNAS